MDTTTETQITNGSIDEPHIAVDIDAMIQSEISTNMSRELTQHGAAEAPAIGPSTNGIGDLDTHEDSKGPEDVHSDHAGQCCGSPGASTPPTSPRPSNTKASQDHDHDNATMAITIPVELREQNALHKKALTLKPTMPADRYCIGVLSPNKLPKNIRKEDDFLWMKGHKVCIVYSLLSGSIASID